MEYQNSGPSGTLSDYDKITYLLNLGNDNTRKLVGKYIHLMFQKRKEIINTNITFLNIYNALLKYTERLQNRQ